MKHNILLSFLLFNFIGSWGNRHVDLIVAQDGTGDFTTLSEAINKLPMYQYQRYVIFIKNGVYNEKIRLEQHNITLLGESRDSTIIQYSQLRSDWVENKDVIGPAVINIHADDIILDNLTIENTQPEIGPHAFAIYGTGTRTIIQNCNVKSKGGDTVSLWNYKTGMYYHSNCYFEGAVDFVCPRGWCYIRDSKFYEVKKTAAIWHAAPENKNQKFVLENCSFDGVQGYYLGRHHYEAQFYLLNCTFSETMIDKPIYFHRYDDPSKNRPYFWGDRHYFHQCSRKGGNFEWMLDNLPVEANIINPEWTFDGLWNPEGTKSPKPTGYKFESNKLYLFYSELLTIRGELQLKTNNGLVLKFKEGLGRDTLLFVCDSPINAEDVAKGLEIISGEIIVSEASAKERKAEAIIKLL
jgi:pectinesterase